MRLRVPHQRPEVESVQIRHHARQPPQVPVLSRQDLEQRQERLLEHELPVRSLLQWTRHRFEQQELTTLQTKFHVPSKSSSLWVEPKVKLPDLHLPALELPRKHLQ